MTIKLGLEVIPGTAHAHGGQYCTKMLPQFRVSDAFCEQLKEFGLGSSGIILGNCTLKFVKNTWREAFVNNIICEHAKVLRAFHIVWIVFQPSSFEASIGWDCCEWGGETCKLPHHMIKDIIIREMALMATPVRRRPNRDQIGGSNTPIPRLRAKMTGENTGSSDVRKDAMIES